MADDARTVAADQGVEISCDSHAVVGRFTYALEEEGDPAFPIAIAADRRQSRVVLLLPLLERQAEVEQRLIEQLPVFDEQRDQQAPDASVTVEKRVDRLELHVRQPHADQ